MSLVTRVINKFRRAPRKSDAEAYARAFAAAQLNRLTASWQATAQRIDDELRADLDALRSRSRDLENNNDYARRYLEMVETNVVGHTGPRLISRVKNPNGTPDTLAADAIEAGWADFCRPGVFEVSGRLSAVQTFWLIARGQKRDGEFILREITGADAGNAYGYALQIIDVARLATWMSRDAAPGLNAIRMGVEIDRYGRPQQYWFSETRHSTATPVPAAEIIHRFRSIKPEQTRGIPEMHAAMLSMHFVGEFALSALVNAKDGADRLGFFQAAPDAEPLKADESVIGETQDDGSAIATSAPGYWETLPHGYTANRIDSNYPNDVFEPFTKAFNRRMASGLNVSYPALCNDHADLNYNSIRATQQDDQEQWRKHQRDFEESWLDTLFDHWLKWALTMGALTMPNGTPLPMRKRDKFAAHAWQHRGWQSNDPLKDVNAFREELELRVNSRTAYAARQGRELDEVAQELAAEEALYGPQPTTPAAPPAEGTAKNDNQTDQ